MAPASWAVQIPIVPWQRCRLPDVSVDPIAIRFAFRLRNPSGNPTVLKENHKVRKAPRSQNQVPLQRLLQCNRDARSRRQSRRDPQRHGSRDCRISPRLTDNIHMQDEHTCRLPFCTSDIVQAHPWPNLRPSPTEFYGAFVGRDLARLVNECHHSDRRESVVVDVGIERQASAGLNIWAGPRS